MAGSPNTKVIFMPPNGDATNDALATATGGARGGKGNNGGGKPLSDAERLAVTNLVSAM